LSYTRNARAQPLPVAKPGRNSCGRQNPPTGADSAHGAVRQTAA